MIYIIEQAKSTDINKILTYIKNMNKSSWIPWVAYDIEIFQDIQNTILNNFKLKPMIDTKNIGIFRIIKRKIPM